MSTYDERIAALEKDAVTMKRDVSYKLDDTNSAVTIISVFRLILTLSELACFASNECIVRHPDVSFSGSAK